MAGFGIGKASKMLKVYNAIKMGVPKSEILDVLGQPDGQKARNGIETYIWSNSEFKGWMRGGTIERKLEIEFEDGKVVGWDGQNMSMSKW